MPPMHDLARAWSAQVQAPVMKWKWSVLMLQQTYDTHAPFLAYVLYIPSAPAWCSDPSICDTMAES